MFEQRQKLYRAIEASRSRPLICIGTSQRTGAMGYLSSDIAVELRKQLELLPRNQEIDLLLVSGGGFVSASEKIVGLLREYCRGFSVLLPTTALSEAAVVALCADEIVACRAGALGPVDAMFLNAGEASLRHLGAFLDKQGILPTEKAQFFAAVNKLVEHGDLGTVERAAVNGRTWLMRQLSRKMPAETAQRIIASLTDERTSHSTWIFRSELREMGLPVKHAAARLERLLSAVADSLATEFDEAEAFNPMGEAIKGGDVGKHATPFAAIPVPRPVILEYRTGIVESARIARYETQRSAVYIGDGDIGPRAKPFLIGQRWQDASNSGAEGSAAIIQSGQYEERQNV